MLLFTVLALWFLQPTFAIYGITIHDMYAPGTCYTACVSLYSELYLKCSTQVNETYIETTPVCQGSDKPFLNSLAWCIETKCGDQNIDKFEEYWYINIPNATLGYQDSLGLGIPDDTMDNNTMWLNTSMLPYDPNYEILRISLAQFENSEVFHGRMAFILILIPWLLVIVGVLYNVLEKSNFFHLFVPQSMLIWFRKYILTPALFKEKCSVPVSITSKVPIDYVPPRIVSITIFLYYCVNVIFCAIGYETYDQSTLYGKVSQLYSYIGNRTGSLSFVNFPILVLFASRNNIFQWLTGWSFATFQLFHRHVAFIAVIEAIIHTVIYCAKYLRAPNNAEIFAEEASQPYWWWGSIATIALSLMLPLSIIKLRSMSYEVFLCIHYVLAILTLIGCAYHVGLLYSTEWGYNYWLYATYAIWGFDYVIRIVRIISCSMTLLSNSAQIELVNSETRSIKISYNLKYPAFQACPDNYYYLYFPTIMPYFTNHPFTLAEWNSETNDFDLETKTKTAVQQQQLVFYVECMKGTTNNLYTMLEKNNFQPFQLFSFLEGPYGGYERNMFDDYDIILVLTGGKGYTVLFNFLSYFKQHLTQRPKGILKMILLNCDREATRLKFIQAFIEDQNLSKLDFTLHDSTGGRVVLSDYVNTKINDIKEEFPLGYKKVALVSCGPPKFMDDVRKIVLDRQEDIKSGVEITNVTSYFSW